METKRILLPTLNLLLFALLTVVYFYWFGLSSFEKYEDKALQVIVSEEPAIEDDIPAKNLFPHEIITGSGWKNRIVA